MQKYLKTVQNDIKNFENTINKNQSKIKNHKEISQIASKELNKLSERFQAIKSEKIGLENQLAAKTKQRQDLLYNGENSKDLTNEISAIKEELELKNDEIIAVQKRVESFNQDISEFNNAVDRLNSENQDLSNKIKGYKFCIEYNMAAKTFLDLAKKLEGMPFITTHPHIGIPAYFDIPFLYAVGQTPAFSTEGLDAGNRISQYPINKSLFYSEIQEPKTCKVEAKPREEHRGVQYTIRNGNHVRTNINNNKISY